MTKTSGFFLSIPLCIFSSIQPVVAEPPIRITIRQLPDGSDWIRFADPAAGAPGQGAGVDNDICSAETSAFDHTGQYILTVSKADGRLNEYIGEDLTGGTAHMRLWGLDGSLIWDKKRSRGPDNNGDGRPDDQVADGEDEIEIAAFSKHASNLGLYVAAAGEDDLIEIWRIRDLTDGPLLADPVFVRTMAVPVERAGGIDGMTFSNSGELLIAGTENAGKIEIWRTTGTPDEWQHVGWADHGGTADQAVNEVAISPDDGYLISAGTNTEGKFWRLDVTRDGQGQITAANLVQLARMTQPTASCKGVAFEPGKGRYVILSSLDGGAWVFDVQELIDWETPTSAPTPVQAMRNDNINGDKAQLTGNRIEPLVYSSNGRFMAQGGGPSGDAFVRVYEADEFQQTGPEPDPVWVADSHNNEFYEFNADDTLLATAHGDGTLRVWDVDVSGTWTIASEGFNERTPAQARWTLTGGGSDWGVVAEGEDGVVGISSVFVGHRGSRFLGADNLGGSNRTLTLNEAWDLTGYTDLQVQFAVAANRGVFEANEGDVLRLEADANGDGSFETKIAEFTPNPSKDLALNGTGAPLSLKFSDFFIDLEPLLPADFNNTIRFRIVANTNSNTEELAFDSLRVTGRPKVAISNFNRSAGGTFQVGFSTFSIFDYEIWYGPNLMSWSLAETVSGTDSPESWTDDGSDTAPHPNTVPNRFYQIRAIRK